jgi:hypothetical protein
VDIYNYGNYKKPPCLKPHTPAHVNVLFYGAKIAISPGENRSARNIDIENVPLAYAQASPCEALIYLSGGRHGDRRRSVQRQFSNEEEKRQKTVRSVKLLSRSRGSKP